MRTLPAVPTREPQPNHLTATFGPLTRVTGQGKCVSPTTTGQAVVSVFVFRARVDHVLALHTPGKKSSLWSAAGKLYGFVQGKMKRTVDADDGPLKKWAKVDGPDPVGFRGRR